MADVVIIGAGPVGLWTALQIKKRQPSWSIIIYERYEEYQRSHVLRLDHWSLLLYGKNSKNELEKNFYKEITGKALPKIMAQAANSLYIKTNDLEDALKEYAKNEGIDIIHQYFSEHLKVIQKHPECKMFIAADGAHSKMRTSLLGEDSKEEIPLQYVVEVKYQVKGKATKLNALAQQLKANSVLKNMAFEYVGKEKSGVTPVTIRFFLSKELYEAMPIASFKNPIDLDNEELPQQLKIDINNYLKLRSEVGEESFCHKTVKITKLTLSLYSAKKFAIKTNDSAWFLVGDAAMGVPYFRALNCGMILGSRLGQILTGESWPINGNLDNKVTFYNIHQPMHIETEYAIARGKNFLLKMYDKIRKAGSYLNINPENEHDMSIIEKYQQHRAIDCKE